MLARVGFPDPEQAFRTYPFELSGGLRQRAMIAMALVCDPALLIADEPTTALDVTIQAQILQLMQELQSEFHMAILFITHDLGVVANMADEVVVLYRGRVMESGSCKALLSRPQHPYLRALLHAVPRLHMAPGERLTPLREVSPAGRALLGGDPKAAATGRGERRAGPGPLLEVAGVRKTYPHPQGRLDRQPGEDRAGGRRRQLHDRARRSLRPGRRERLRQDHRLQDHHVRDPPGCRQHHLSRRRGAGRRAGACAARSWSASAAACSTSSRTRSTP